MNTKTLSSMENTINIDAQINSKVNKVLLPYALAFPPHAKAVDLKKIEKLIDEDVQKNIKEIEAFVFNDIMSPAGRAQWFKNRLELLPEFHDLCWVIDSAYLSYCRGNQVAAHFAMVPVIEGIIYRWRKTYGGRGNHSMPEWIKQSLTREPSPEKKLFMATWSESAANLIEPIFSATKDKKSYKNLNRNLLSHLLDNLGNLSDTTIIMRYFLITELLIEIYICEKHKNVPTLFNLNSNDARWLAYKNAHLSWANLFPDNIHHHPEFILHTLYKDKNDTNQ